ncbi:hypothetical protein KP509_15G041100 [Ceratopteris richardii]|uniref:Protein kinase domain-containing protein n=3 Tax=Ceratopteris richardii TaxID=49495 RepID=A0A8T2T2R6_CERRI|nr:hypothetical protein KP509_15G041100 [Ceratopteris richardii]KAH7404753.1 hypothetical protein KP509_15G041100 [Ceratopteris richardii]
MDFILMISVTLGAISFLGICFWLLWCFSISRKEDGIRSISDQGGMALPIRVNAVDASQALSDTTECDSPPPNKDQGLFSSWFGASEKSSVLTNSGLPSYPFKDLQKATNNFTSKLGEGAFGPVFKATMPHGGTFAIKVLSSKSKQGEREFLTEVALLGRLHHRNLVNLMGYCAEKEQRILVYEYMSNGSLAQLLYGNNTEHLSWDLRVQIAQDVARGIEYLHEGAVPPIIHRDIKSANILLDGSMRARVSDFGLSKEVSAGQVNAGIKGTFGYLDPEYISTNKYTLKSDVYSFGVLLFELVTARSPQKGLMDYVSLALLSVEGEEGWEEILDERIYGQCNLPELAAMANLAKQCVSTNSYDRPRMRDASLQLSKLGSRKFINQSRRNAPSDDSSRRDLDIGTELPSLLRLASIPEKVEV